MNTSHSQYNDAVEAWRSGELLMTVRTVSSLFFDTSSKPQMHEISTVFLAGLKDELRNKNGIEQWFEPDAVSYESRKQTYPLLAADMLAWTIATIRARELFMRGRFVEVLWLAKVFVATENVRIGFMHKDTLAKWESDTLLKAEHGSEEEP
jgi:hypothetical protein